MHFKTPLAAYRIAFGPRAVLKVKTAWRDESDPTPAETLAVAEKHTQLKRPRRPPLPSASPVVSAHAPTPPA